MHVSRFSTVLEGVAVDTNLADADAVDYSGFSSGEIYIPSGSSITTLTFHVATNVDGTFLAAENGSSTAITATGAAGKAVPIPSGIAGAGAFKMVGNADGTVDLVLKS